MLWDCFAASGSVSLVCVHKIIEKKKQKQNNVDILKYSDLNPICGRSLK